eukprot:6050-Heterococcus_DN1.PRE.2
MHVVVCLTALVSSIIVGRVTLNSNRLLRIALIAETPAALWVSKVLTVHHVTLQSQHSVSSCSSDIKQRFAAREADVYVSYSSPRNEMSATMDRH